MSDTNHCCGRTQEECERDPQAPCTGAQLRQSRSPNTCTHGFESWYCDACALVREQRADADLRAERDSLKARVSELETGAALAVAGKEHAEHAHNMLLLDVVEPLKARVAELEARLLKPELPPYIDKGGLPRYGLQWPTPTSVLSVPMPDGYWTPWHLAAQAVKEEREACAKLAFRLLEHGDISLDKAVAAIRARGAK